MIRQIVSGNITLDTEQPSCGDFFGHVMGYIILLINGKYDQAFEVFREHISDVNKNGVIGLSSNCLEKTAVSLRITITAFTDINMNIVGMVSKTTQTLGASRGLLVEMVSKELPFNEQANAMKKSLRRLRGNCDMADRSGQRLLSFLEKFEPSPVCQTGAELQPLMDAIMALVRVSARSLKEPSISEIGQDIVTLVENSKVSCISIKIEFRIRMLVNTIQDTVTTYVSQIALVEQRSLQITGSLTFSNSIELGEESSPFDFKLRERRQKQQLRGLMRCGGITRRSIQSIEISKRSPGVGGGSCKGRTVLKKARKITAMCSSNNLQLEEISKNTQDLARCTSNLDQPLSEGEVASLEFILTILASFRVTFSSQIIIVQQSLSTLTGQKFTGA